MRSSGGTWTSRGVNVAAALGVGLLLWATAAARLPQGLPGGILLLGLVVGSLNGLLAIGLVLIYRTGRIVNFAQGGLGAFSSVLAFELITVAGWSWWIAVPLSLGAAVLASTGLEVLFLRRLARAPRHLVTVATIGLAQILTFLELVLQPIFERLSPEGVSAVGSRFPSPFSGRAFDVFPVVFRGDHVMVLLVVPVILLALVAFMHRSWIGVGVRGVAENAERAGLLGIPTPRLSTYVWAIAGLLSAVTAILKAPVIGFATSGLAGPGLMLRGLAAAAVGRMTSLPRTFAAAVVLGVVEQTIFFNYARTAPIDGLLLGIIVVAFLAQRRTLERSAWSDASSWQAAKVVRAVPEELRSVREVVNARRFGPAALIAVAALPPMIFGLDTVRLVSVIFVYGMVGVSLVVLTGWGGQIGLGQWAVAGIGAFVAAWMANHSRLDFIVILVLAALSGVAVSLLLGLPAMRIRGIFAGVTTLAFAIAAGSWFFTFEGWEPGRRIARPVLLGRLPVETERAYYFVVLVALVLVVLAARNLRSSRVGRLLVAVRDNEHAAAAFGVTPARARLWAFGVAGSMAGLAGGVYAYLIQRAAPADFPAVTSLFLFAIVVIGGLGSITGALIGAAYVQGAQYLLPEYARFLATGVGMLLLLIAFPGGLSQVVYDARDRLLKRVARKRGILVPSLLADRAQ